MTVPKRGRRIQHNVNFDKELVPCVVGAQVLDLTDGGGEAHGEIEHCAGSEQIQDSKGVFSRRDTDIDSARLEEPRSRSNFARGQAWRWSS